MRTVVSNYIPPGAAPTRTGPTLVEDVIIYDTPLQRTGAGIAGTATQLVQGQALYKQSNRIGNPELCNIEQVGQLANGQELLIQALSVEAYFSNVDLYQLLRYCRLQVKVQDAVKFECWAVDLPAGGGVNGSISIDGNAAAATAALANNGLAQASNVFTFQRPIEVAPFRTFEVQMNWTDAPSGMATAPLAQINADEGEKLIRFKIHGIVGKDILSN